jgi:error-prone DNA polymerase
VAIIRPCPIQGNMVHPYLARREGTEPVTYLDDRLKLALARTLGIPLFQEQVLRISMILADFSGSEAEELRRALSYHRSEERMQKACVKLRAGMQRKGVAPEAIEKIIQSIQSLWLPGVTRHQLRPFGLRQRLDESASGTGVLCVASEQSTDGLLCNLGSTLNCNIG